MRKNFLMILAAIFICIGMDQTASAQITINIPGILKFPKEKKEQREPVKDGHQTGGAEQVRYTTGSTRNESVSSTQREQEYPPGLNYELERIENMRVAIDKYGPDWPYWPEITGKNYLLLAVSKREREKFFKELGTSLKTDLHRLKLHAALDALAVAAAKKLPAYKPVAQTFSVRSPANEKIILQKLKERLGNAVTLTIYKSGFQSNWLVYKDSVGLPQYRFMRGYIYAKNTADDHPYCHLYYVSVSQQYAGGGTYGSSYATFEDDLVVGCP